MPPRIRRLPLPTACAIASLTVAPWQAFAQPAPDWAVNGLQAWIAAYNARDAEAIGRFYAADALLRPFERPVIRGRTAIAAHYRDGLASEKSICATGFDGFEVAADVGVGWGWDRCEDPAAKGKDAPYLARWMLIYERGADGAWQIVQDVDTGGVSSEADEKAKIESVVRDSENSFAARDCDRSELYNAPGGRWIQEAPPLPLAGFSDWCRKAKAVGFFATYDLDDFKIEIDGDVAWVTLSVASVYKAPSREARAFAGLGPADPSERRDNAVESIVLRKIAGEWKIVLGHTSILPAVGWTPATTG